MNEKEQTEFKAMQARRVRAAVLIQLQSGCLTFALALMFIIIGFLIDYRLGTTPRWTLILLIGSAPFVLGGVFLIARRTLRGLQAETNASKPEDEV
jgi:F0F1-type ATP synthase assembly protein I